MRSWPVVLAIVLAGCAAPHALPAGLPSDGHGGVLPTIQGTVVDEAVRPLADAEVRFLGTDIRATTDGDGHYEMRRPTLRAEDVLVTAVKQGYAPRTAQATVSGHHTTRIDFGLEPDPYFAPHVDTLAFRGSVACQAALDLGSPQRASCETSNFGADRDTPVPWQWNIQPVPGLAGVVVEVTWQPETALAQTLHASLVAPMAGGKGGVVQAEATGPSPLRLEIPADAARGFDRWTTLRLTVEAAPDTQGPAGAAFTDSQRFDAVAALFYVEGAPPGYTFG